MKTLIKNSYIYSSQNEEFFKGCLLMSDEKIAYVGEGCAENADVEIDACGALALPGFIDIHTHGRAGYDFCSASTQELEKMKKSYLESGTTSLMPTLASAPYPELLSAIERIVDAKNLSTSGARLLGIHLEGRYLNPNKRGAHAPELLSPLNTDELKELISKMTLPCHITAALELDESNSFADTAHSLGATLGLGHTEADYACASELLRKYNISFSHLFNAMPPLHHRDGGAVAAGLTEKAYCELICDGMHVSPEMIRMSYMCLTNKRFALVTDSMEASGCPDGTYSIAGNTCEVRNGRALTTDGKLAGSTLNMKSALENLMDFCSIPLSEAVRCATLTPAELAGVSQIVGSLDVGKRADVLLVREDKTKNTHSSIHFEKIISGGCVYG